MTIETKFSIGERVRIGKDECTIRAMQVFADGDISIGYFINFPSPFFGNMIPEILIEKIV